MLQEIYEKWMPPTPAFKANHEGVPKGTLSMNIYDVFMCPFMAIREC